MSIEQLLVGNRMVFRFELFDRRERLTSIPALPLPPSRPVGPWEIFAGPPSVFTPRVSREVV